MADEDDEGDIPLRALNDAAEEFRKDERNADLILVAVHEYLEADKLKELYDFLLQEDNKDVLEFVGWEIIGILCKCLGQRKQIVSDDQNLILTKLLNAIAETCSAKEVCIGVLEQLSSTDLAPAMFLKLLNPLQTAILRLGKKKSKFLKMAIPFLPRFIRVLGIKPHDDSSNLPSLETSVQSVLDFFTPFIEELSTKSQLLLSKVTPEERENEELTRLLLKCFISLLEYPLSFHSLTKPCIDSSRGHKLDGHEMEDDEEETSNQPHTNHFRGAAEQIMKFISTIKGSYVYLVEYWLKNSDQYESDSHETSDQDEEDSTDTKGIQPLSLWGLACFSYLLFVENVRVDYFPAVFSNEYLLQVNIKYVLSFVERTEDNVLEKGLALISTLIEKIEHNSLKSSFLDQPEFLCVAKAFTSVMVMSQSRTIRKRTVKFFPAFVAKFDTRGRYRVLRYLLESNSHSGVGGLLINLVKEEVNRALDASDAKIDSPLMYLVDCTLALPKGLDKEVDVAEQVDSVLASLNCLRFILLKDNADQMRIWARFARIEKQFLEPLRHVLKVARLNYQAELRRINEDAKTGDKVQYPPKPVLQVQTPDGQPIEHLSLSQQTQVLESALNSLDVVESVLARVVEIADCRQNQQRTGEEDKGNPKR